ncbi:MAG: YerC/YecD family TrpR-related protein [Oscillospiraceae bacterium]|nr:YerC/YecD family TrpR-related protein [Oscillospiraceae bacterium]
MNDNIRGSSVEFLFRAILALETMEECYDFFEDLCTVQELKAISQRIVVAKMLSEKRVYSDIVRETGASTATISRVNRSLVYGSDGYERVFTRIQEHWKGAAAEAGEDEVAGE